MRPASTGMSLADRRRRRRRRAGALIAALAVAAGTVWIIAINKAGDTDARVACPAPATAVGQTLPYSGLDTVDPVPASTVGVRVLNASSQVGLAMQVGQQLQQFGFGLAAAPGNDPLYPAGNMSCVGQIRFGPAGEAAARTLSLAVPCTQLVRDNRSDATVDLALGTQLTAVAPNTDGQNALAQLAAWARAHPQAAGGAQSDGGSPPHLDAGLLAGAHTTTC